MIRITRHLGNSHRPQRAQNSCQKQFLSLGACSISAASKREGKRHFSMTPSSDQESKCNHLDTTKHGPGFTFSVHSTFRDHQRRRVKPNGLQYNIPNAESHLSYALLPSSGEGGEYNSSSSSEKIETNSLSQPTNYELNWDDPTVRWALLCAHNVWSFARDEGFRTLDDIEEVVPVEHETLLSSSQSPHNHLEHFPIVTIKWKKTIHQIEFPIQTEKYGDMVEWLRKNPSALSNNTETAPVYLNGDYLGVLDGPETLPPMELAVQRCESAKLCFKRYPSGLIRFERYFPGYLRDQKMIMDHILDNLYALEDIEEISDEEEDGPQSFLGTATLPDWIMGGMLTSRLHIIDQRMKTGKILFQRPLQEDNFESSVDRRFEVDVTENCSHAIAGKIQREMMRLRYLAKLPHPIDVFAGNEKEKEKESDKAGSCFWPDLPSIYRHSFFSSFAALLGEAG